MKRDRDRPRERKKWKRIALVARECPFNLRSCGTRKKPNWLMDRLDNIWKSRSPELIFDIGPALKHYKGGEVSAKSYGKRMQKEDWSLPIYFETEINDAGTEAESAQSNGTAAKYTIHQRLGEHLSHLNRTKASTVEPGKISASKTSVLEFIKSCTCIASLSNWCAAIFFIYKKVISVGLLRSTDTVPYSTFFFFSFSRLITRSTSFSYTPHQTKAQGPKASPKRDFC